MLPMTDYSEEVLYVSLSEKFFWMSTPTTWLAGAATSHRGHPPQLAIRQQELPPRQLWLILINLRDVKYNPIFLKLFLRMIVEETQFYRAFLNNVFLSSSRSLVHFMDLLQSFE